MRETVGFASDTDGREGLKAASVWCDLKSASLPFLRCAALFYHHLTNVPGPPDLVHFAEGEIRPNAIIRFMQDFGMGADNHCTSSHLRCIL